MIGGPNSSHRMCGSRSVWMNSFLTMWPMRRSEEIKFIPASFETRGWPVMISSAAIIPKATMCPAINPHRRALQKNIAQDGDVIARRQDARDPLHDDGHLIDGKDETRKEESGQQRRQQSQLAGRKLRLGRDRE